MLVVFLDDPTWRPSCRYENYLLFLSSQRSPLVLPRWHRAAAVAEAAAREVVAQVGPAAERLEVLVARVERQAQLAEQQPAPPMRERRRVAA
jgi:hypothetical protein